jgi:signal transduction histidine kinase
MNNHDVQVLLVEDDGDDALLIREWLTESEAARFTVEWVNTYQAALEALERSRHDVYLVDYRLGPHSGLDLVRAIIAQERPAPVILLTGVNSRTVDLEAMEAGAADYLPKAQLSMDMLERSIRYALTHKRTQIALQKARDELELRVQERTARLVETNAALRVEMAERQSAEEKLRQSERLAAITVAAAKLAHEIGNPLNGMSTTVQILERHLNKHKHLADETLTATIQDLKQEIDRLRSLLQGWRALARPQPLTMQPVSLATVIAEVLRTQAFYYDEYGVSIEQTFPPQLPLVIGDQEKLTQALLNLCKNAVEAMPHGGVLTIRGDSAESHVLLTISDTGVGIPAGLNILEPFTTTKEAGTGLGLAIVQQIVTAHAGTMTYTSTPGQGTTFLLQFPIATGASHEETDRPPIGLK